MWALAADLHASSNPRDAYRFLFWDWFIKLCRDRAVSTAFLLGDLTMDKDRHDAWLVNEIADRMKKLADVCNVHILKGNHDYLAENEPFFQFLDHINAKHPITYYSNATAFGKTLFLPHTRDYKTDWSKWIKNKFKDFSYVFAHQTFEGADVGARKMKGIPLSIFDPKVKVFSGDIHVPQTTGPVTYIGSPYTVKFGDDWPGRVILLDPQTDKWKDEWYNGPQKKLVLTHLGKKKRLDFTDLHPGDIVKIKVDLNQRDYENWAEHRRMIKEEAESKKLVVNSILPNVIGKKEIKYKKIDAQTDQELVRSFAKRSNLPDVTLNIGLSILKET